MNDQNFKYFQIFENFENPRNFLLKSANFFVLFYDVHKETMFTIKIEDVT